MTIVHGNFQIESSFSSYADEAYINQNRFLQAGIFSASASGIDSRTEGYTGILRDYDTLNPTINTPTDVVGDSATLSNLTTKKMTYVRTQRNYGYQEGDISRLLTNEDGFAKVARDSGQIRANQDELQAIAVLDGVIRGNVKDKSGDLVVNISKKTTGAAIAANSIGATTLVDLIIKKLNADPADFVIVTGWEVYGNLIAGNFVSTTSELSTHDLGFGTYRGIPLLVTRSLGGVAASNKTEDLVGLSTAEQTTATDTSKVMYPTYVVKRGSIALLDVAPARPVEIERTANSAAGGGSDVIFYRWGNIMHPLGYTWTVTSTGFPTNAITAGNLGHVDSWNRSWDKFNTGVACIVSNG